MDILVYIKALVMGVIEGLTEFLPISSTGHLIIAGELLDFTGEKVKTFAIFIQLGAILAVCWYYRNRLLNVIKNLPQEVAAQRFLINLLIAFMPAAILGLALHKLIKAYLFHPLTVACALIVGGFIILLVERMVGKPKIQSLEEMRWQDALKVGCTQVLSLIPGTSRSGATIIGGLIFGLSRQVATEFSFFLAIPVMFTATCFDLVGNSSLLQTQDIGLFAVGFVTAFISALLATKAFLWYVANHNFSAFAWYRIVFGSIVFVYFWLMRWMKNG